MCWETVHRKIVWEKWLAGLCKISYRSVHWRTQLLVTSFGVLSFICYRANISVFKGVSVPKYRASSWYLKGKVRKGCEQNNPTWPFATLWWNRKVLLSCAICGDLSLESYVLWSRQPRQVRYRSLQSWSQLCLHSGERMLHSSHSLLALSLPRTCLLAGTSKTSCPCKSFVRTRHSPKSVTHVHKTLVCSSFKPFSSELKLRHPLITLPPSLTF